MPRKLDLEASIDTLELSPEVMKQLKAVGATTIGVLHLMTLSDLLNHFNKESYAKITGELRSKKVRPKSDTTPMQNKAVLYGGVIRLPVGYLQVREVITGLQREALEMEGVTNWGQLVAYTERNLLRLKVDGHLIFTQHDIEDIHNYLRSHHLLLRW